MPSLASPCPPAARPTPEKRAPPDIPVKFETLLDEAISLIDTGSPNGCARPCLAEIGFVGKAPGKSALYLGAADNGSRLNRLVSPSITIDNAVKLLAPVIKRYDP